MLPSSAGRLLILLDERSRYTRLCSLAMSGGMRDSELSLRCRAVRWVRDHRAVLRLLTLPVAKMGKRPNRTISPRIQRHFHKDKCERKLSPIDMNKSKQVSWFHSGKTKKKQTNMFAIFLFDSEDLVITCVQLCKAMEKNMWEENKFKNPQMIYLHKQKILTTDFQLSPVWLLPICCLLTGHNCVHPPGIRRVIFFLGHSYNTREIIYILINQQLKVY